MGKGSFEEQGLDEVVFQPHEPVERLPLGDGPIAESDDSLPVWLGVVAELQSIGLDVVETYSILSDARRVHLGATLALSKAEDALADAQAQVVLDDAGWREGKNAEVRAAVLHTKTADQLAAVREARAREARARTDLTEAQDNERMVRLLVEVLGK